MLRRVRVRSYSIFPFWEKKKGEPMPYCPNCRYEYKDNIVECPDCGAKLVEKLEEETIEDIKYVPFRTLPSRLYAEMLKEALEKEGIPSIIKGDDVGIMLGSYSTTSPVEVSVWVQEENLEGAEQIADQMLDHI
jgi:DNA-directed RNA polymerase subunit RPC12/RpoP